MKIHCSRRIIQATVVAVLAALSSTRAQMPGAGDAGMTSALTKLFGDIKAFSAKAQVQVLDSANKQVANMPMDFSLLDKKIRVEIDLTQAKNTSMPPGAATTLKQMGMAQVVSLVRPDQKLVYVMYPDQKVMMTMPLPDGDADMKSKTTKTPLGKETLDGHACVKNKVVITPEKGETIEAITWNATDLKDFPVQIQTKEKENTSFVRFQQVQFAKPDSDLFEPPAGFTKYNDPQELMQGVMKKVMEGKK